MDTFSKSIIRQLKKLPIDIGQAERKHDSAGKKIACSFIPTVKKNSKVALDVGCRDGYWSEWLKNKGYKVISLDIEPHYKGAIQCDIEQGMPLQNGLIDVLFCTEVIEHLHAPRKFLKEVKRVMKKDGVAVFTTPNSNWWLYWVLKIFNLTPQNVQNPDHKQYFNYRAVERLFLGATIFGYFPYIFRFYKISHLVGSLSPTFIIAKKY